MTAQELGFQLAHIGMNHPGPEEGNATTATLSELFGLPIKEGNSSNFVGSYFEVMKKPYLGTLGHFSVTTVDCPAAREWLESTGIEFDDSTAKYDENGKLKLVYAKTEIGGFAFHITQR